GDEQALAHVHLAEEGGDGAVGIDGDVGGELIGRERRLGALREGFADAEHGIERTGVPIETTSAPPALSSERRETMCVPLSCLVIVASLNPSSRPRARPRAGCPCGCRSGT